MSFAAGTHHLHFRGDYPCTLCSLVDCEFPQGLPVAK
jgi:hypothetical protein